jgi:Fuc2NAc and GlcNAc transferase
MVDVGNLSSARLIAGSTAVIAFLLVGLVRRYALHHQILDHPGPRASHSLPTPRGGGLGLVAAALLVLLTLPGVRSSPPLLLALVGVALTALVGWLDDRNSLGVRTRLAAHLMAGLLLLPLAHWPSAVPSWMGVIAGAWWVFWTVSAINVVNFMDGIDGLIGSQAFIFGAYLALRGLPGGTAQVIGLALAGASFGFLFWNWPPARIFLGDVGSGALGMLFVLGGLLLVREGAVSIVTAFLPLYPLFLDASVTLVRRLRRGERITEAHRTHLYQRLANGTWGHARVALLYAALAMAALPVAALPAQWRALGVITYFLGVLGLGWALDRRAAA